MSAARWKRPAVKPPMRLADANPVEYHRLCSSESRARQPHSRRRSVRALFVHFNVLASLGVLSIRELEVAVARAQLCFFARSLTGRT
jgi:hypothetical protein